MIFVQGIVLHTGPRAYRLSDRVVAAADLRVSGPNVMVMVRSLS